MTRNQWNNLPDKEKLSYLKIGDEIRITTRYCVWVGQGEICRISEIKNSGAVTVITSDGFSIIMTLGSIEPANLDEPTVLSPVKMAELFPHLVALLRLPKDEAMAKFEATYDEYSAIF